MVRLLLLLFVLCLPLVTWALYKPVRVLAPQWVDGVSCPSSRVCVDDTSRYHEALALYEEALGLVRAYGPVEEAPRAVFCSTQSCFRAFGFDRASAQTVGTVGIVIGPRGWMPHYVRHEMIHHLQAEHLGVIGQWLGPRWFIEGMAYALSEDPRETLAEPWQQHREKFKAWYEPVGKPRLWEEARKL